MYSYLVAGANLFGQWFTDDTVIEGFKQISTKCPQTNFNLNRARLVQANWSYNIFEIDGEFFVSGLWGRQEKKLTLVPLPIDFPKDCITIVMVGNDNYLFMIDAEKLEVFVVDLNLDTQVDLDIRIKRVVLEQEIDEDSEPLIKKYRKNKQVLKAVMTNNACILMRFLNREVKIYAGLYPYPVQTNHVMGTIVDIQCGYEHYMLLTDTGKVYTWGNGRRHQLGHGMTENISKPQEVRALAGFNIKIIRAGGWHTAVVSELGNLYMWGWNDMGQSGIKSCTMRKKEVQEGPSNKKKKTHPISTVVNIYDEKFNYVNSRVIDVVCGSKHTVIMLSDFSIWAAGSNEYGQLGLPVAKYTHVEHFVKVYQGTSNTVLRCGPWSTIIEK